MTFAGNCWTDHEASEKRRMPNLSRTSCRSRRFDGEFAMRRSITSQAQKFRRSSPHPASGTGPNNSMQRRCAPPLMLNVRKSLEWIQSGPF